MIMHSTHIHSSTTQAINHALYVSQISLPHSSSSAWSAWSYPHCSSIPTCSCKIGTWLWLGWQKGPNTLVPLTVLKPGGVQVELQVPTPNQRHCWCFCEFLAQLQEQYQEMCWAWLALTKTESVEVQQAWITGMHVTGSTIMCTKLWW